MSLLEKFIDCCKFIKNKILWIILIPALMDLVNLLGWEKLYNTVYYPVEKLFIIKFGFIGAPPSISFLLEDFPSFLLKYNNNGISGIINRISLFNAALLITVMLITSFLNSMYMVIISTSFIEKVKAGDVFRRGNELWHKFFLLNCITWIPLILTLYNRNFIFLTLIFIIFIYVQYSFVTDQVSIKENFKLGAMFFFDKFGLTVKLALFIGAIFSISSLILFPILKLGKAGVVVDILICAYLGAAVNKMILEIYSEIGQSSDTQ